MKSPRVRAIARSLGWRRLIKGSGVYSKQHSKNGDTWYTTHFIDKLRKTKEVEAE